MDTTLETASGSLTKEQLAQFDEQGYLVVTGLLSDSEIKPLISAYEQVLDELVAELMAGGELADDHGGLPFAQRYYEVCKETGKVYPQRFNISLPPASTAATPSCHRDEVFRFLTSGRILDAVESLIGPEIELSPVGNARAKPPERLLTGMKDLDSRHGIFRQTPWHQDNGVVLPSADATRMTTAWLPLTDAPVELGCLQVIPGSHRGELLTHCPKTGELIIPDKLLPHREPVALPMRPGDALFLHRRVCHRSLPNVGAAIRWSFDLRYQPSGQPSGREELPSFLVRSKANPEAVTRDPADWRQAWQAARGRLAARSEPAKWNRWSADAVMCA